MRILLALLMLLALHAVRADDFQLSGPTHSATLMMPDVTYQRALRDFAWHIGQVTGHAPAIALPGQTVTGPRLVFDLKDSRDLKTLDDFSFDFPEAQVMRITCTPVSLQWALNRIMEDHGGIRFLMPEYCGTHIPRKSAVSIPRKPAQYHPSFYSRSMWFSTPEWQRHTGMYSDGVHFNHEIYSVIFPTNHYNSVGYPPEIMPLHKGKKITKLPYPDYPASNWQPCYSNPKTATLAAENILKHLEKHPETLTVSLTINDSGGFCECEECRKANGGDKVTKTGTVVVNNQSEVYFKWVNKVASIVARKHPTLLMPALAYSQVLEPPSFKLHPNVPIVITLDLYATTDPQVRKKNLKLIADWSQRASIIGCWDYAWGYHYALPRMYIQRQIAMMRYLHQHNARIHFLEYETADCHEGPKPYLYTKLLWDINADADAILKEWYDLAVGPKAAPYLRGYFDFWEDYFAGSEIRKTPWFASARYVYMTWGPVNHMYGLKKGDLTKARSLMEKVVQLAETKEQKQRAQLFMRRFQMSETMAALYGAEPMPPKGLVETWQDALAICQNIATCAPHVSTLKQLKQELAQEPIIGRTMYKANRGMGVTLKFNPNFAMAEQLCLSAEWFGHPQVAAAARSLARNRSLPEGIRKVASYLAGDLKQPSECPAGTFEDATEGLNLLKVIGDGAGSQKIVPLRQYGKGHALQLAPGKHTTLTTIIKAKSDSLYLLTFKLFIPKGNGQPICRNTLFACKDDDAIEWWEVGNHPLPKGKWLTLAMAGKTLETCNGFQFNLDLDNFEPKQLALVDDIRLVFIEANVKRKPLDLSKGPAPLQPKDGFTALPLALNGNLGLAKDITLTMRTYKDGVKTAILKGSKTASLSHFYYNGAPIMASRQDRLIISVKVKGKGRFTCGTYVYNEAGTKYLSNLSANVTLEGEDYEVITHEVDLTDTWGKDNALQIRPLVGFSGGGGQAEVVSIQYRIIK